MLELHARKPLTTKQRVELFRAHNGMCCLCIGKIMAGELWDVEHRTPVAMGGTSELANLAPAHRKCHAVKTKIDVTAIAKAKRIEAKHFGAKIKKPWPSRKFSQERYDNTKQIERDFDT
jgi:5-methylcytosine-specific restriction enzyme A